MVWADDDWYVAECVDCGSEFAVGDGVCAGWEFSDASAWNVVYGSYEVGECIKVVVKYDGYWASYVCVVFSDDASTNYDDFSFSECLGV